MTCALLHRLANTRGREIGVAFQQLSRRPFEANKRRRIDGVCKISSNWTYRRLVAHAKPRRLNRVIEVPQVFLVEAQRKIPETAVNIPHVMEEDTLDVLANEREAQFDVIDEQ